MHGFERSLRPDSRDSRGVLRVALGVVILFAAPARPDDAAPGLPSGPAPAALEAPYFPDRAHAVIFRNWGLVDPARIAKTIGTDTETVQRAARSMGLRADPDWRAMAERGYITALRQSWHLLPYAQLLTLLDVSAEELAFRLREDDFLFIKLGSLKPRCEPVVWSKPDAATRARAERVRASVERHFGASLETLPHAAEPEEPRFSFVAELSRVPEEYTPRGAAGVAEGLRYLYSYFGVFGDPLGDPSLDPYPDGLLARLAAEGVNGVWLHTVLRQLAPGTGAFAGTGSGWERRLETLRTLVARARRHGIGVYLYMNEPRSMPTGFFADRPQLAGVLEGDFRALCTSVPAVRRWLADSLAHVFREVPELAGIFSITASENLTSCASHARRADCARCASRSEAEIIAEVIASMEEGVHRSSPQARVIAWDWGWKGHGDAPETIARLPDGVWLQSVSEWAQPVHRGGVSTTVGEYSLSVPGPGPRATRHWSLARERGLRTVAKVQLGATWELASVPFVPVLDLVAEHCAGLARAKVDGTMLGWTLGGYPSPNLRVAATFAETPDATIDEVLDRVASARYGRSAGAKMRLAWRAFSDAFREFPYHGSVVYNAPQQVGAANPVYPRATRYSATMVGIPYDDLDGWRGPYPREVFAQQMRSLATKWKAGIEPHVDALELASDAKRAIVNSDLRVARAVGVHFASVANQAGFVIARDRLLARDLDADAEAALRRTIGALLDDEIRLAREQYVLTRADSRLGFEATNHYFYAPVHLLEKVLSCEHAREVLLGGDG